MGIDEFVLSFLLYSRRKYGIDLGAVMTLGRQHLICRRDQVERLLARHRMHCDPGLLDEAWNDAFAEHLLRGLGARSVESVDASEYEGATYVVDLNGELPPALQERYNLVVDGGTLEHVFNFPKGLTNSVKMIVQSGHFLGCFVCNNFAGHGFYQISPELAFRAFAAEQGLLLKEVMLIEPSRPHRWYRVLDPVAVGARASISTSRETYLMVLAQRIQICEPFAVSPQQTDYASLWARGPGAKPHGGQMRGVTSLSRSSYLLRLWRALPPSAKETARRHLFAPGRLNRAFVRVDPFGEERVAG